MDKPDVTVLPNPFRLRIAAMAAVALSVAMAAAGPPDPFPRAAPVSVNAPVLADHPDTAVPAVRAAAGPAPTAPAPPPPSDPDPPEPGLYPVASPDPPSPDPGLLDPLLLDPAAPDPRLHTARSLDLAAPDRAAGLDNPGPAPGARYAWPLHPAPIVRAPFRPPAHPYGPGHRGVDLGSDPGRPVLAARAGTVVFAGPVAGRGVVSVRHDDDLRTTYQPVRPLLRAGAQVATGQVIGTLEPGLAGCPDPACLHWGVRRGPAEYLDPLILLRPSQVRLLPVPEPWPLEVSLGF